MAKEIFTGPLISLGGMVGNERLPPAGSLSAASGVGYGPVEYSDEIGPSGFWAGIFIPATSTPTSKDKTGPGAIPGVFGSFPFKTVSSAFVAGAAALTTAANAVANTPLALLTTYAAGRAPVPAILNGVQVTGIGLDLGLDGATFALTGGVAFGGLVTGTATLTTTANAWRYQVGRWLALLNGGASGSCVFSQITNINASTGVLSLYPPPGAATTGQITFTNRFNPNAFGAGPPTGISSELPAGSARISIPEIAGTRGVGILGVTGGPSGIQFLVTGLDGMGVVETEIITSTAGATTAWGKKTYEVILSCVPLQSGGAFNFTLVTSDFIGLPVSVMSSSGIYQITMAGTVQTSSNFTVVPADITNPPVPTNSAASPTSGGDARGGIQVTANGPATAPGTPMTLNGTNVLQVYQILDPLAVCLSSPINPGPLLGVPPV